MNKFKTFSKHIGPYHVTTSVWVDENLVLEGGRPSAATIKDGRAVYAEVLVADGNSVVLTMLIPHMAQFHRSEIKRRMRYFALFVGEPINTDWFSRKWVVEEAYEWSAVSRRTLLKESSDVWDDFVSALKAIE